MKTPRILAFSGSTRAGSHNTRLLGCAVKQLLQQDCEVTRIDLADYELPIYDGDLEAQKGIPKKAQKLARLFHEHDGFLIATPEYNGSITPLTKNTLDWVSRVSSDKAGKVSPFRSKVVAICAASPGAMGGSAMLFHLRDVLFRLGVLVLSEQLAVGNAASAFDDMDRLTNDRHATILEAMTSSLVTKTALLKSS